VHPTLALLEAAPDLDGRVVGPSDARATVVVVFASWCPHCRHALDDIAQLVSAHPRARVLGVNYKAHEEYDGRGDAAAVRAYLARTAPWLRVVPADGTLFAALGRPPYVPTIYVYDRTGALVSVFDRRERGVPDAAELGALLARLGA
jgi:thiol-disulfide isomerase/thioredoxin